MQIPFTFNKESSILAHLVKNINRHHLKLNECSVLVIILLNPK